MPKSPLFPPSPARRIEILSFPGVQLLDVTGPLQVFATTNEFVAQQSTGAPPYHPIVVAKKGGAIASSAGLRFTAAPLPKRQRAADTLIVAGGPGVEAASGDDDLVDWLGARAARARRTASVCTGAYLLAATGALDGRRAVTHWSFCEDFARRFPAVRVESDPIFVCDSSIWTSAGVTADIDLALAMVEQDLGRRIALAVARYMVVFLKRPGGQAQSSAALSLQTPNDRFETLHGWMGKHIAGDLSLPVLAEKAGMSERSFSRHYAAATGLTPARAVERLRVEAARRMLDETPTPVKRVAQRRGFGSEETMRRSFLRSLSVTPQDYRARFSG